LPYRRSGFVLGDEIAAVGIVRERRAYAAADGARVERLVLGFERHRFVATGEELEVARDGVADADAGPHRAIIAVADAVRRASANTRLQRATEGAVFVHRRAVVVSHPRQPEK
jgi:hypothetical protein